MSVMVNVLRHYCMHGCFSSASESPDGLVKSIAYGIQLQNIESDSERDGSESEILNKHPW